MKQWGLIVCLILCLGIPRILCADQMLVLVMDDRYWYPFTYWKNGKAEGMHADIVKDALKNLGYAFTIRPLPRKRGIRNVIDGAVDGMISLAFEKQVGDLISYPADASRKGESLRRIMQVDHMVVTYKDAGYEFRGDITTLPEPVRIPRGESLYAVLRNKGLRVEEVRTDEQNFRKLLRDRDGSIITTSIIAESMDQRPTFHNQFIIQATPISSQSYHLVFSKKSRLSRDAQQKIWDEIARLRDDYVYMLQLFAQY